MNDNDSQSSIPHPDIEETINPSNIQKVTKNVEETEIFTLQSTAEELVRQLSLKSIPVQKGSTQIIDGILPVSAIVDNKMDDLEFFENLTQDRESIEKMEKRGRDEPLKVVEKRMEEKEALNIFEKMIESTESVEDNDQSVDSQKVITPKLDDESTNSMKEVLAYDYQPVFSDATYNPIVLKGTSDKLRLIDPNFMPIQQASNLFVPYFTDITIDNTNKIDKVTTIPNTKVDPKMVDQSDIPPEPIDYAKILSKESVEDNPHLKEDMGQVDVLKKDEEQEELKPLLDTSLGVIEERKMGILKKPTNQIEYTPDDNLLGVPILLKRAERKLPTWMPRPARPPNCPYGLEYLTEVSKLQVQQTLYHVGHLSQVCFMVKNDNGQRVYNVHSDTCYFMKFLCASRRRFEFRVLDESNREIIHLSRPRRLDDQRKYLQIHAPVDQVLGRITKEANIPGFTIQNAEKEVIYRIEIHSEPSTKKLTFAVLSMNGDSHVANITPVYSQLAKKIFHSNVLNVEYFSNLDVKPKALILGAAFLIDLIYFELF